MPTVILTIRHLPAAGIERLERRDSCFEYWSVDPVGGLILHGFMSSIPIRTVGTMFSPQARGMSDHLGAAYSEAGTGLR